MKILNFFSLSEFNFFLFIKFNKIRKKILIINCCDFCFYLRYFFNFSDIFILNFIFSLIPNFKSKNNNYEFFINVVNIFKNNEITDIFIIRHKKCKYIGLFKNKINSNILLFNWLIYNFNQKEICKIKKISELKINEFLFYKIKKNLNSFLISFDINSLNIHNIFFNF